IGGVKVGDRATFTVQAFPGRQFEGTVRQVRQAPVTVQNVVTYDVVVAVSNTANALKPGMHATTRIIKNERDDVLLVAQPGPRLGAEGARAGGGAGGGRAAKAAGGADRPGRVWVLRDGKPAAVPVRVGLDDGTSAEVVSGEVQEGDRVIVAEPSAESSGGARQQAPRLFRPGGPQPRGLRPHRPAPPHPRRLTC